MTSTHYGADFFRRIQDTSRSSAREIVPYINELLTPKSVVDVGCGVGTWLSVFAESGVTDLAGLDGEYVDPAMLEIADHHFHTADLTKSFALPRRFDLAVSLEVAEHLPKAAAFAFVKELTSMSDVVLFSAAIPHQGGTHHVNEQWPSYWVEQFAKQEFVVLDCLRNTFWDNANVAWWYAQNMFLFVRQSCLDVETKLRGLHRAPGPAAPALVHPKKFSEAIWESAFWRAIAEIRDFVPAGTDFVLIDEGNFIAHTEHDRHVHAFPSCDGCYSGIPADDAAAIEALAGQLGCGIEYIVLLWPAFWWLDHYRGFDAYLNACGRLIFQSERARIVKIERLQDGGNRVEGRLV